MVTTKQLPKMIEIIEALKKEDMTIVDLSRKIKMPRSTLIYYLSQMEKEGDFIEKEVQEKVQGKPTILKFNRTKYFKKGEELKRKLEEDKKRILLHPLTFEILNLIKKNPALNRKELNQNTTDYFRKASHLTWLIQEGYIVQRYEMTSKGEKFLAENSEAREDKK